MAPSSKPLLILTVLSLAAAAFAGAALWLPRRRRRASPDAEGDSPASVGPSVADSAPPPPAAEADSLAIIGPVPSRLRAAPAPRAGLFSSVAPRLAPRAGLVASVAPPAAPHAGPLPSMGTIAGPLSILSMGGGARLEAITGPLPSLAAIVGPLPVPSLAAITLSVMPARRMTAGQEITIWWETITYFLSQAAYFEGTFVHTYVIIQISFSRCGVQVLVLMRRRSAAPIVATASSPTPAQVAQGAAELAAQPSSPTGSDSRSLPLALSRATSAQLARTGSASSAGLARTGSDSSAELARTGSDSSAELARTGSGSSGGFFLTSSSVSRASSTASTSTSQEEVDERRAEEAIRKEELRRRRLARNKKSGRWWKKIGWKLQKRGVIV